MQHESSSGSSIKPEFSIRTVVCDHYLSKPAPGYDVIYSEFRGSDIKQVPILRVFGPTPEGYKACLHIHGVFPYFYIPCPSPNPEPQFMYQIAASLDKALNIALKQATSANQHVYKISLVKGLPFYGYHDKEHLYLKVFLYNPGLIKQAVELCSNGAILGQPFQPHESHLNFTLQFFIDFNLFGMSNIDLQTVKFRKTGISQNSTEILDSNDISLKPESMCYYEADCVASHIINRQRIGKGDGIENPGLEEVWNQEKERRKQLNISLASKSLTQGRPDSEETESHYKFQQMYLLNSSNLLDKPVLTDEELKPKEQVYYPAESSEGSQLINAVDVSVHLPEKSFGASFNESCKRDFDTTLVGDADDTIVDETVVLNNSLSLHYSQVLLDNEDLELLDLLQDMDEKPVDEDSIMGTPAGLDKDGDSDLDDAEYSQAFDDDTILLEPFESKDDGHETSLTWNDSFWDGANIPQLDGTCDDDHVKKVRKRKMRPFKLGLARPKSKKKEEIREQPDRSDTNVDSVESDEINASRETIDSISEIHIKGSVKHEPESILVDEECTNKPDNVTLTDLVNKMAISYENTIEPAAKYDLINKFEPMAGPSRSNLMKSELNHDISMNLSYDSTPEDNGIISFYDKSKLFDVTLSGANVTQDLFGSINDNDQEVDTSIVISKEKLSQEMNTNIEINEAHLEKKVKPHEQRYEYNYESNKIIVTPRIRPPKKNYVASTLDKYNIPKIRNPKPYYSDHKDVGDKVEIGHTILKLQSNLSRDQKPFEKVLQTTSLEEWRQLIFLQTNEMNEDTKIDNLQTLLAGNRKCILEPIRKPPSKFQIMKCLEETKTETVKQTEISKNIDELDNSQAIGLNEDEINSSISLEASDKDYTNVNNTSLQVTKQPDGSFLCFGNSESMKESSNDAPVVEVDFLTSMLVEVHASVRGELHPDPLIDPIRAVFITTTNDCPPNHFLEKIYTEIIVVDNSNPPKHLHRCVFNQNITYVNTEYDLLESVIERVKKHDPDIICGYEIEVSSWGYILERSQVLGLEIVKEMSRITEKNRQKKWRGDENDFEGRIIGRIMFNVWRLFRHELALSSYSFENCMYEVLKERVPKYSYAQLSEWWNDESRIRRWIPVEYYLTRLHGTVRMLDKLDIINRTSELARLFGLQWWEVLSRGSQFRVESLMLRATRPLNLIALSPTVRQRASMKAPECLPLIFEPESRFYSDPVIVLDFQSLYPSMMIAYNYCFSTCIGKVQNISGDSAYEFGAWRLRIPKRKLDTLVQSGLVHWSPVGAGFVKPSVRRGVLPALLRRILAARQAVKKGMKLQTDEGVKKAMHSRQLGLKLIANVTYGYTAANFSGRMPCVEVADSVVAKGRETLRRAIKLVEDTCKEAKVVYGDTDSMFVVVPGAGRAQAFALGQRIADAVTADNPAPVALKLEKVYQPCILQTKKRYVGFMYESPDQEKPVYEAKGIETVRRDGCPAGVKLLQRSLCELFSTGDVSAAKREARAALSRLATGATPPHELFFTREYHGANGYRPGAAAPPNEIAKRVLASDRRACPRPGQRVPWLVTAGPPGAPLVRLARSPAELKAAPAPAHIQYYAARVLLPPLHRCFSLLGVDVFKWWNELGYNREVQQRVTHGGIARYMCHERCAICGEKANVQTRGVGPTRGRIGKSGAVCVGCSEKGGLVAAVLTARVARAQTDLQHCQLICDSCCGHDQSQQCENTECPVLWRRAAATQKLKDECVVIAHLPSQPNQDLFF